MTPNELAPDQFNEVRDLIERKVKELLASLGVEGVWREGHRDARARGA